MKMHGTRDGGEMVSDCGAYRYLIWSRWGPGRLLSICMLNPSTANGSKSDPTWTTVRHFAQSWLFDGVIGFNLFGYRSSKPSDLKGQCDPVGPENSRAVDAALRHSEAVVAAWGSHQWLAAADDMKRRIMRSTPTIYCLGTTANGSPKHPLARGKHRIPRDQCPIVWRSSPDPVACGVRP